MNYVDESDYGYIGSDNYTSCFHTMQQPPTHFAALLAL